MEQGERERSTSNGSTVIQGGIKIKPPPMMSDIVPDILTNSSSLDLSNSQKKGLSVIREKYVFPMTCNEGDFKINHIKVNDILLDPSFDPNKAKAEMKVLQEFPRKEINMAIDAIAAIRDVIGVDNFKVIMDVRAIKRSELDKAGTIDEQGEWTEEK